MSSELIVDELTGRASAGSIAVTAEGGTVTTNLQQGLCKVWARTNMATAANSDSFNVSSLSDGGTGVFTVNINNNMNDGTYTGTDSGDNISSNENNANQVESHAAGSYVISHKENGSSVDTTSFGTAIHGDLA